MRHGIPVQHREKRPDGYGSRVLRAMLPARSLGMMRWACSLRQRGTRMRLLRVRVQKARGSYGMC